LADRNINFFQKKVKLGKYSADFERCSEIGGKSETGGDASLPWWGMDARADSLRVIYSQYNCNPKCTFKWWEQSSVCSNQEQQSNTTNQQSTKNRDKFTLSILCSTTLSRKSI